MKKHKLNSNNSVYSRKNKIIDELRKMVHKKQVGNDTLEQ